MLRRGLSRTRSPVCDCREPHRIPREYLLGTKSKLGAELPDAPLVVFINSRSGGRAGARLTQVLCHVIGHAQARPLYPRDSGLREGLSRNVLALGSMRKSSQELFKQNIEESHCLRSMVPAVSVVQTEQSVSSPAWCAQTQD